MSGIITLPYLSLISTKPYLSELALKYVSTWGCRTWVKLWLYGICQPTAASLAWYLGAGSICKGLLVFFIYNYKSQVSKWQNKADLAPITICAFQDLQNLTPHFDPFIIVVIWMKQLLYSRNKLLTFLLIEW
jgi:hypothetical protein